jgi:hypothetical protein
MAAQRLPNPSQDDGTWGDILNGFLLVEHNSDGSLKIRTDGSVAPLSNGKVPTTNLGGGIASSSNFLRGDGTWAVPSGGGSSSLAADTDVAVVSPSNNQVLTYNSGSSKWQNQALPVAPVTSVNAQTGTVIVAKADVGLSNVDNTSDVTKNSATVTLTNKTISGASNTFSNIPESAVTNLAADLAAKASSANLATVATSGSYTDLSNKPSIPGDATTLVKGSVQLAGDLSGTAANPSVAKVNGVTLPAAAPASGTVLTATSSTTTAWTTPAAGVTLDATATDIQPDTITGTAVAGSTGKAADAGHQHTLVAHDHSSATKGGAIPESSVTNLSTDLAAKAPLASPTFTGTVTAPTLTATTKTVTPLLQVTTGAGTANQVLTSDVSGNATWTTPATAPVSSVFSRTGAITAQTGDYNAAQVTNAADKATASVQTFTGNVSAPVQIASGSTGATAASRYVGGTSAGAPVSGTFAIGDFVIDQTAKIWVCITAGTPGTWVPVGVGTSPTAPSLHGYAAMSMDPAAATSTSVMVASTHYVMKMIAQSTQTVSKAAFFEATTQGVGCSGWYVSLYDATGTLIAGSTSSSDQATAFNSLGNLNANFGSATSVVAGKQYYLSLGVGTATTFPAIVRSSNGLAANLGLTSGTASSTSPRWGTSANAYSAGTAPATLGTISTSGTAWLSAIG